MPRACPVECSRFMLLAGGNVKHTGPARGLLRTDGSACFCTREHETPQGKPVVFVVVLRFESMPRAGPVEYHVS